MGMRSMNALVVKTGHSVPAAVAKAFDVAFCGSFAEGKLWVWETNISPLWARHGVLDLLEEVTILGWLTSLPKTEFKLTRVGEELGTLGEWDEHPFRALSAQCREVLEQYDQAVMEATPDSDGRLWHKDAPPHLGWYLANPTRTHLAWRFWNGKNWSIVGLRGITAAEAAEIAKLPECESAEELMWWSDYWPEGLVLNRSLPPADGCSEVEPVVKQVGVVLSNARRELVDVIKVAAAELGEVSFRAPYADGLWAVFADKAGNLRLGGYAAEMYPAGAMLHELSTENLVSLADAVYSRLKRDDALNKQRGGR